MDTGTRSFVMNLVPKVRSHITDKQNMQMIGDLVFQLSTAPTKCDGRTSLYKILMEKLLETPMLDLRSLKLGDPGIVALGQALQDCGPLPKLRTLILNQNDIGDEGAAQIGEAIKMGNLRSLRLLGLSGNKIGERGCKKLAQGFASGQARDLLVLDLWDNQIVDEGIEALAEVLKAGHLPSLEIVSLGKNPIHAQGGTFLCNAFRSGNCVSLRWLTLSVDHGGSVEDEGFTSALTEVFKSDHLPVLERLYLGWSAVTCKGLTEIGRALDEGRLSQLTDLSLDATIWTIQPAS